MHKLMDVSKLIDNTDNKCENKVACLKVGKIKQTFSNSK